MLKSTVCGWDCCLAFYNLVVVFKSSDNTKKLVWELNFKKSIEKKKINFKIFKT